MPCCYKNPSGTQVACGVPSSACHSALPARGQSPCRRSGRRSAHPRPRRPIAPRAAQRRGGAPRKGDAQLARARSLARSLALHIHQPPPRAIARMLPQTRMLPLTLSVPRCAGRVPLRREPRAARGRRRRQPRAAAAGQGAVPDARGRRRGRTCAMAALRGAMGLRDAAMGVGTAAKGRRFA